MMLLLLLLHNNNINNNDDNNNSNNRNNTNDNSNNNNNNTNDNSINNHTKEGLREERQVRLDRRPLPRQGAIAYTIIVHKLYAKQLNSKYTTICYTSKQTHNNSLPCFLGKELANRCIMQCYAV